MTKKAQCLIAFSLPKKLKKRIDAARGDRCSRSALVRDYIERGLKRDREDDKAANRVLSPSDWKGAIRWSQLKRIRVGKIKTGDVTALRKFLRLNRKSFAKALGVSTVLVEDWELRDRKPVGAEVTLLSIGANHPRMLHQRV